MSIPDWRLEGDWFDVCTCNIPCPCSFAQPATNNSCDVIFVYHFREGHYGDVSLNGLNAVMFGELRGNVWGGDKLSVGFILDASASEQQQNGLAQILTGKVGGWMGQLSQVFSEIRGVEFLPITVKIDPNLENWQVEIPGVLDAGGKALTGPTSDPKQRVQTTNPPGSEVGPSGKVITWASSSPSNWARMGFKQTIPAGQNSKHMTFQWTGPDQ
ncbi:MAG: DUF1326 domain-containing protein [Methylobacter sp.]